MLFEKLDCNIYQSPQSIITYFLDCLSLLEPEILMEKVVSLVTKKIVKHKTKNLNTYLELTVVHTLISIS